MQRNIVVIFGILFFYITLPFNAQESIKIYDGVFFVKGNVLESYMGFEEHVIIPADIGITEIGARAFANISNLMSTTIPEGVNVIGEAAFFGSGLTSITMPEGVNVIEEDAFAFCINLANVNLPEGVTTIRDRAFWNSGLTNITIPSSVTFIGDDVFTFISEVHFNPSNRRSRLINILVDERNTTYSSIDGVLFNKDKTILIQYPAAKNELSYVIPSSITTISNRAFHGNRSLERITIPKSVVYIEEGVFYRWGNLKTIIVSRNTRIARNALPRNVEIIYSD
jgi:hypothetical protein